jgi:hypothetical protein
MFAECCCGWNRRSKLLWSLSKPMFKLNK